MLRSSSDNCWTNHCILVSPAHVKVQRSGTRATGCSIAIANSWKRRPGGIKYNEGNAGFVRPATRLPNMTRTDE